MFEEIKILIGIDLNISVREKLPVLLEKVAVNPMFITGRSNDFMRHFSVKFFHRFSTDSSD